MDKRIPGFKIANGNSKVIKEADEVKKPKRKHLKFDTTPVNEVLMFI